jgi:hypothetical protein
LPRNQCGSAQRVEFKGDKVDIFVAAADGDILVIATRLQVKNRQEVRMASLNLGNSRCLA